MATLRSRLGVVDRFVWAALLLGLCAAADALQAKEIKIGLAAPLTGAGAESGRFTQWGAQMAVDEINAAGGVNGDKLLLVVVDDQTTNPGEIAAFSRLALDPEIAVFLGSIRSTQVQAVDPEVRRVGKPMFIGGTQPELTQTGNKWLFRMRPSDAFTAKAIAAYGVKDLHMKKWAIVSSTDAFGSSGSKLLIQYLKELGETPVLTQSYANKTADFTPVVLAVRGAGAQALGTYTTFEQDTALLARQARQLGLKLPWIGSAILGTTTTLSLAGPALHDTYGVVDYIPESSAESKAFAAAFEKKFKSAADHYSTWPYDAVKLTALVVGKTHSTDPAKLREAILSTKNYKGAQGTYTFDPNGDGLHSVNVVHNVGGKLVFIKNVDFSK